MFFSLFLSCYLFIFFYHTTITQTSATITATTYFGARNGLETLSQLIVFDDLRDKLQIIQDAYIEDKPVYPYRGILLDTSRNFISVDVIKKTIEAMSMSKLNTFHWHITDSHSFPYEVKNYPLFSKYGSYGKDKVYTKEDIKDITRYALLRGVRVLPEFDAPAHVGEGWQWVNNFIPNPTPLSISCSKSLLNFSTFFTRIIVSFFF